MQERILDTSSEKDKIFRAWDFLRVVQCVASSIYGEQNATAFKVGVRLASAPSLSMSLLKKGLHTFRGKW